MPHRSEYVHYLLTGFVAAIAPLFLLLGSESILPVSSGASYYIDCAGGDNNNSGVSPDKAWQDLSRANSAPLVAGDRLLLKRGCTWIGPLQAQWNGTVAAPVVITAYGIGTLPLIEVRTDPGTGVVITGSYQIIEHLETRGYPSMVDPGCKDQPVGWYAGFEFRSGASYNVLRYSTASRLTAGVNTSEDTHHNQILHNILVDNHIMNVLTPTSISSTDDLGAWGIIVKGRYQEVGYNYLSSNKAWCSYDEGYGGDAIELYSAQYSTIHHNTSINDRVFSEVGGAPEMRSDSNTFAYNLIASSVARSRFLVVRGDGSPYGPTWRTRAFNNTVVLTHPTSQGVVCHAGCSADILTLANNILWAEEKAAYADAPFSEAHNIYWRADGHPFIQFEGFVIDGSSLIADPRFVGRAAQDFHLATGSPAIDSGTATVLGNSFAYDLANYPVGAGSGVDRGAYEFRADNRHHSLYVPLLAAPYVLFR